MKNILTLLIIATLSLNAATFNVSTTPELRTALTNAASNGEDDTIVLADGTYKTTDDGGGTFIYLSNEANKLTLQGSSSENVILSGDSTHQILNIQSTSKASLKLEKLGFIDGYYLEIPGGGAVASSLNTSIINCNFMNNFATFRGGAVNVFTVNTPPSINEDLLEANITNSTFTKNIAGYHGGAFGSSVLNNLNILNSTFTDNNASLVGGALDVGNPYNTSLGTLKIMSSTFKNNSGAYGTFGSYFYNTIIMNTIIANNNSSSYVFNSFRNTVLTNSLIVNNNAAIFLGDGNHKIINNIFINNDAADINCSQSSVSVTLNNNYIDENNIGCLSGNLNNIFNGATLGFVDEVNGDYNLTAVSDLIDAGTTAITGLTLPTTDLNGNVRIVGGNIDIGPYEFSTTKPTLSNFTYSGIAKELGELTFSVDYTLADGRAIDKIEFDYTNNGTWSTSDTHTYDTAGAYTVSVKVSDSEGESSIVSLSLTVAPLPFADMTDEQKLVKAIDPAYYDDILSIVDTSNESARASGVTTGENNVLLDPSAYSLVSESSIDLSITDVTAFSTGWTLTSTPFTITDLSMFESASVVWVYNNTTASWSAYSSNATTRQKIIDSPTVNLLTTIPAGSGVWVQK